MRGADDVDKSYCAIIGKETMDREAKYAQKTVWAETKSLGYRYIK